MSTTTVESTGMSEAPTSRPRWVRLFIDFAFFAAGIVLANLIVSYRLEWPIPYGAPVLCVVLLIHGGWRVVPATLGVGGLMAAVSIGLTWWDGVYLDSRDIWPTISIGASFGLPVGAYFLPSAVGRHRVWGIVSILLWFAGLLMAGFMSAALWYWVAEKLALGKWL
jgi:hypothetical protein